METSKCRGCGKEIWWVKTKNGKNAPVDLDQTFAKKDGTWMVDGDGHFFKASMNDAGYMPHFATCPQAANFRKE